jgi:hypothetical protein
MDRRPLPAIDAVARVAKDWNMRFAALLVLLVSLPLPVSAQDGAGWARMAIERLCPRDALTGFDAQIAIPDSWLIAEDAWPDAASPRRVEITLALPDAGALVVERRLADGVLRQFRVAYQAMQDGALRPAFQAIADGGCVPRSARAIRRGTEPWVYLDQIDGDLTTLRWTEILQAPWPPGTDSGGVRVGLVDSGLAYDLPVFRDRLARDESGKPLGHDYWDGDPWPYDGDVSRGAFFPIRHGTTVASILAREAPAASLVPYRYPRPDMGRMADLVARAAGDGVRILAMPLGSNRPSDWEAFAQTLSGADILAIVSAGNDGRDIDARPVYPAALDLPNIVVVTSSDGAGRLARGSNWGAVSVDIMLPAENLPVTDFRGALGTASGSSYAVPRLAAMAARILEAEPGLTATALRDKLFARAVPSPFERDGVLSVGWIADPLDD